jgi:hypothetical protein
MLQVNASKPLNGVGEQAYQSIGKGYSWITFRKGRVFVYLIVGLADPRQPSTSLAAEKRIATEVATIAVRFSKMIVDQIGDN